MSGADSKALAYVKSKGWGFHDNGDQIILDSCPINGCDNGHFYIAMGGQKDGLFDCKKCGECGNLRRLQEHSGDRSPGVMSFKENTQEKEQRRDPLPDYLAAHRALLEDTEALSYLEDVRGYSLDMIKARKLGVVTADYKAGIASRIAKEKGAATVLVIPYVNEIGNCIFAKYRTLPPMEKMFDAPYGYDAPLYNEDVLKPDMEEILFVEGEGDALSLLSNGVNYVVGVPGANNKKANWIGKLDKYAPKHIYMLYDGDKVGQDAAYKMATRIGIEKVLNIIVPPFEVEVEPQDCKKCDGKSTECQHRRPGKDINEWFASGKTLEDLEILKKQAMQFDVEGVKSTGGALDAFEADLDGKSATATYMSPWPSLNKKFGGAEPGDVIDIIAEEKRGKTTFALQWADFLVGQGFDTLFYCLEMPPERLVRKWVSCITQTDDTPAVDPEEAELRRKVMKQALREARALAKERAADMLFGYTPGADLDKMFDTMKQAVRRYGVKVIVFDNIQAAADKTLKNPAHRTIWLSQISKRMKDFALEHKVLLIRIIQPTKIPAGQIVGSQNADGSSQLSKDCDVSMAMHRNSRAKITASDFEAMGGFVDEVVSFDPQTMINIDRCRYAPGGQIALWFYGNLSTFVEFTEHQRREAEKTAESMQPTNGGALVVEGQEQEVEV